MVSLENLALSSAGTTISGATCQHLDYSISNILDGSLKTFWPTTGMYPQEFIVNFPNRKSIKKVILSCRNVAEVAIYREASDSFERVSEQSIDNTDSFQTTVLEADEAYLVKRIKIVITKGHEAFCSIHKLVIYGNNAKEGKDDALNKM